MSPIATEILRVTKQQARQPKEEAQQYLWRVAVAVNYITNSEWDLLSEEAKAWFNGCCDARYQLPQKDLPEL